MTPPVASTKSTYGGRLVYGSPTYMRCDSLAVESGGNVAIGTIDAGGITVISPQGEHVAFDRSR